MDANLTTLLGGGAIVATVTMLWDKIRFVFSRLMNILVVNIVIDEEVREVLWCYLSDNFKLFKFQPLAYSGSLFYIKPIKIYGKVLWRDQIFGNNKVLYFKGLKPLIMTKVSDSNSSTSFSISFFRGSFNIEKLLIEAADYYNATKVGLKGTESSRFNIHCFYGNNYSSKRSDNGGQSETAPNSYGMAKAVSCVHDKFAILRRGGKFLRWQVNNLGEEQNVNRINYLAFPKEVESFLKEIELWKDSKDWYKERQIPWKKGMLFYGKPGTGKSALVSAIAQLHDFPICVFDLPSMSNKDFKRYWSESRSYSPCIVLIEDIDNVFQGRTNITKGDTADSLTFDCLLNTISGVQDSDGILLIITTNNIEGLDEALGKPRTDKHVNGTFISTRPGRVDRVLELKTMDEDCRRRLASRILNESPEFIEKLIKDGDGDTGAQFQERCSQVALSEYWRKKKL